MKEKVRFLGLDVHAETIAVAVAEPDGEVRSLGTIPNRGESIRKMIKKLGPAEKLRACYEAGPTGYVVYWQLAELGIQCEVVAPTLVPVKAGDRVKTDRRDAEKLARCYRSGDLTAVWVPDEGSEALRDLVRAREAAKQDQMRARHRLSKFLLRSGQRPPTGVRPWTRPYLIWVAQLRFTQIAQESTRQDYLHEVEHMRERVGASGASHHGSREAGLARVTTSHQRSTGAARNRRYLGCNHCGRVGPGIPLWQCSAADGLLRCCAKRRFQW
jgi:transposase